MLCNKDCILRSGTLNSLERIETRSASSAEGSYGELTTRYRIMLKDGREVPAVAHYSNLGEPGAENSYILLALEPDLARIHLS